MTSMRARQLAVPAVALAVGLGVAGCTNTVGASDIASNAKAKFDQQFASQGSAKRVASVSCPRDLEAKTGATEVCTGVGTPGDVHLKIKVTVTSVSGSTAHFSYSATVTSGGQQSGTGTTGGG